MSLLLACQPGCIKPGPSRVGQGEQYSTGDLEYDAFFTKLFAIQQAVRAAPTEEQQYRKSLSQALGEDPKSSSSALARAVRQHAQALAQAGVYLRFEIEDDDEASAQADLATVGHKPPESEQPFLQALREATLSELKLSLRMARAKHDLEELRFTALQLDKQLDTEFRLAGPRKKAEVRTNLQDAVELMPLISERAEEAQQASDKLLRKLLDATRSDGPGSFPTLGNHVADEPSSKGRTRSTATTEPSPRNAPARGQPSARSNRARSTPRAVDRSAAPKEAAPKAPKAPKPSKPERPAAPQADFEP